MNGCFYFNDKNEIKVGEYIRTANGEIHKVEDIEDLRIHIETGKIMFRSWVEDYYGCHKEDRFIVKHSKNIIDLIEKGDIVHTIEVVSEDYYYMYDDEMIEALKETIKDGVTLVDILTHEQYKDNCYRVKE